MLSGSRCPAALLCAIGGAVVMGAPAAANWLTGYDTAPLSYCTVTNINDPGDSRPGSGKLATVYVDVSCPNHQDD